MMLDEGNLVTDPVKVMGRYLMWRIILIFNFMADHKVGTQLIRFQR